MRPELDHFDAAEREIAEKLVPLLEQRGASLYRTGIQGRREARVGWPSTRDDGARNWVFLIKGKGDALELTLWVGAESGLIGVGRPLKPQKGDQPKPRDCGSIVLQSTRFPGYLQKWVATAYAHAEQALTASD